MVNNIVFNIKEANMKVTKSIICSKIVKNKRGEIIGSKEIINEFHENGKYVEYISRGIVKFADGRVLINKIIQRIVKEKEEYIKVNLLTGVPE